jgi:uncharacterized membrane protein YhaH (DUF805 family)
MNYYLDVLKNYAKFDGRARRSEFWYFTLFNMVISFALGFIAGILAVSLNVAEIAYIAHLYSLAVLVPSIAVWARRMHDVGKSGWYMLIPIYNIVLAASAGDPAQNSYGADPKAGKV